MKITQEEKEILFQAINAAQCAGIMATNHKLSNTLWERGMSLLGELGLDYETWVKEGGKNDCDGYDT